MNTIVLVSFTQALVFGDAGRGVGVRSGIRELRARVGWTQAELATRVGVTLNAVNRWERGLATPRLAQLERLATVFDVPLDAVAVGGTPSMGGASDPPLGDDWASVARADPAAALVRLAGALDAGGTATARGVVQRQANAFLLRLAREVARDRVTTAAVDAAVSSATGRHAVG